MGARLSTSSKVGFKLGPDLMAVRGMPRWGTRQSAGVDCGCLGALAVGAPCPLSAAAWFAERVGQVGDAVTIPVGGDGRGRLVPREPQGGVVGRRAEPRQPWLSGGDGSCNEFLGALLDQRCALGQCLPHVGVCDMACGRDQSGDQGAGLRRYGSVRGRTSGVPVR